jgi:surfeit locus 1 family protein
LGTLSARQRGAVVLVSALIGVASTARLGFWQLDRVVQKTALQRALDERGSLPSLDAAALPRDPDAAAAQHYRPVRLQGQWLAEKTVYLENRPMNGRAGFIAITPLRLNGGAVLVQRGWFARDATERTRLPNLVTPSGVVGVQGLLAAPPSRLYEFTTAPASSPIRQNLDFAEFAREAGLDLYPVSVLEADTAGNQGDGLLRQWPRPAFDVHKNYGYAAQWFALAALITGLYVWFQIVRPRLRARAR